MVSSPESTNTKDAIDAILSATADLAAARLAYGERVAQRLGLAATDVDVLRRLAAERSMTVGRIGEVTGLTTGATTRLVDRLEQSGFVRRVADPTDRRRVVVEAAGDRASAVATAYAPAEQAARTALEPLDGATLAAFASYLDAAAAAYDTDGTATFPDGASSSDRSGSPVTASVVGPLASAHAGRLVFVTAAPSVTVKGSRDLGSELYRARFSGAIPSARVRDGAVTIRYPRLAWYDWRARIGDQWINASAHWRRDRTDVLVNATIPWRLELRGGASALTADLRHVRVEGVEITGGAGAVSLALGAPSGVVRIRFRGGTGDVIVTRPAGTAASLTIKGGARSATLDGFEALGSLSRVATPGADEARDRYEIELHGGANKVIVRGE
jgi:DNA-binding MarR family transcriptional regulator